jgi:hypothetical protein
MAVFGNNLKKLMEGISVRRKHCQFMDFHQVSIVTRPGTEGAETAQP